MMDKEEVLNNARGYFNGDDLAAQVWVDKYCLRNENGDLVENSPHAMHKRLAEEIYRIEQNYINPLSIDEIFNMFKDFKYLIPGGSPMAGIGNNHLMSSLSNCFVIHNNYDHYGAIFVTDEEQVQLMKRRGGVGHDLSMLRPAGASTSNSAKSATGVVSFMKRYSNSTGEVAQVGRRGALMLSLSINHPDAENFIKAKQDRVNVVYANVSLRVTDDFMRAVVEDDDFYQTFPINLSSEQISKEFGELTLEETPYDELIEGCTRNVFLKKVKARKLWKMITESAWAHAEPGVLFWDRILNESPARGYGEYWREKSTNPCGELPLPEHDSCRLMALNLYSYVDNPFEKGARFNFEKFKDHARKAQRIMDNLVELEIEKIEAILIKIKNDPEPDYYKKIEFDLWNKILGKARKGRRTGLGITAEGDMIAALGLTYGDDSSIKISEKIHKSLAIESYISSIILASERGCFKEWNLKADKESQFLQRILPEIPKEFYKIYQSSGRRNIGNLTIAPTGSVSILTQTTSGIEPAFLINYKRRRKIEQNAEVYDYKDDVGDKWLEYNVFHHKFIEWFDKNWYKLSVKWFDLDYKPELETLSDDQVQQIILKSPYNNSTSNDVNWLSKVKMQGAIQKWVDHSISVTVNIPKETPIEVVDKIYQTAWENGCKGCTIYRDGSRSGVLLKDKPTFEYQDAVKRPDVLPCQIHRLTALKQRWMVLIGLNDGKPFEVFTLRDIDGQTFPEKITEGIIKREGKRVYSLTGESGDKEYFIENIAKYMTEDESVDTRKYSLMLRSRIHPKHIVEQIDKYATITSFDKAISRVLKMHLNGYGSREKCSNCGSNLEFLEGCLVCKNCGYSKCG